VRSPAWGWVGKMEGREGERGRMQDDYSTHATQKFDNEGEVEFWNIVFIFYVFSDVRHSFIHPLSDPYSIKETLNPKKG